MASADLAVRVENLQQVRGALRAVDRDALKEVQQVTKRAAEIVATEAKIRAPKLTGALAGSIRATTSGARGIVRSPLPYANVQEWGGRVGRNKRTFVRGRHFVMGALEDKQDTVQRALADGFDDVLRRNGFT
jgi:phage gpG-like protein